MMIRFFLFWVGVAMVDGAPIVGGLGPHGPKDELVRGLVLLSELNCTSCHQSNSKLPMRNGGPVLSGITQRFSTDHLLRFIDQPQVTKPGTVMPDVLGHLTDEERGRVAGAIGQYLILSPDAGSAPPVINRGDIEQGRRLYSTIGCLACHGPDQEAAGQVPLGLLAEKYHLPSLVEFLKNPLRHRPTGRMPDLRLTHFEALDLATYLLRNHYGGIRGDRHFRLSSVSASRASPRGRKAARRTH